MSKNRQLNNSEIVELKKLYKSLILPGITLERNKRKKVQQILNTWVSSLEEELLSHPIIKIFRTMIIVQKEIGLGQTALLSILLYKAVNKGIISIEKIEELFDKNVSTIIIGLNKVYELYNRNSVIESENFRKLLLSFAENLQVILIILAERLDTMRFLSEYSILQQEKIAYEASYLYAPLAHRIGLYGIKTELEDLALKYTAKDTYKEIAKKLNASFDDNNFDQNLNAINLSLDTSAAFDSVDSLMGASTTVKSGTALYSAALPTCRDMAAEVCSNEELAIARETYRLCK